MANREEEHYDVSIAIRRKMITIVEDLKEILEQGKKAEADEYELPLFKGMCRFINNKYEKFEKLFDELSELTDESGLIPVLTAEDKTIRAEAKSCLYGSNAILESIDSRRSLNPHVSIANSTCCSGISRAKAKLPTLHIMSFDGKREQWPKFRDTFESLIIQETSLSNIDKFHYLVSVLKGSAASTIAGVPITEANFEMAWKILKDIYDNKRLLAASYLNQLLDLEPMYFKPTPENLNLLIAKLSETVAAFKLLDVPDQADYIFFHIARRSLDPSTREAFEVANNEEFPTFENLIHFLRCRSTASELAASKPCRRNNPALGNQQRKSKDGKIALHVNASHINKSYSEQDNLPQTSSNQNSTLHPSNAYSKPTISCYVCKGSHLLVNCFKFNNAPPEERQLMLQTWKGCRNCLRGGHSYKQCRSRWKCKYCHGSHHSTLCLKAMKSSKLQENKTEKSLSVPVSPSSSALNSVSPHQVAVMLGTALCGLLNCKGKFKPIRLAIDTGSHFSFINQRCAELLGLRIETQVTSVWGVGQTPLKGFKGRSTCTLSPLNQPDYTLTTNAIVVDNITSDLPGFSSAESLWSPYLNYNLADNKFWLSRPIDFLIGCDLINEVLTGPIINIHTTMPTLVGTIFGYIVLGRIQDISEAQRICTLHTNPEPTIDNLYAQIKRFWEMEEPLVNVKHTNPDDKKCEELFLSTHSRLPCGRFVVRLPFKESRPKFSDSYGQALRRLSHLETRLGKNSALRKQYNEFMQEYLNLGHMELAKRAGEYIIPHHCVFKGEGDKMKIRVVFDAAARTSTGSLNDALLVGPKLQANITDIHLNFRLHKYAFVADAEKMFRQILLHYDDRVYQHILWRFNVSDAVKEYELNTVSYGQTPSSYLAIRCIQQLALEEAKNYPLAHAVLLSDCYIDDIATGAATLNEAVELKHQLIAVLAKGGFKLAKWAANHPDLLEGSGEEENNGLMTTEPISLESEENDNTIKVLGLQWNPSTDVYSYKIVTPVMTNTKRAVLSFVAKIYDPLGFLGPAVLPAKLLIQQAWKQRLGWDDIFPPELQTTWSTFLEELPALSNLELTRWVVLNDQSCSILIFADASEKAYCASAYLRTESEFGTNVYLLMSKIKLAPLKTTSIPRLELCAALLAARLWKNLQPFCKRLREFPTVYFFTDSTIVLAWLKTPSFKLKTFVANRIVTIREITSSHSWKHVSSKDNPSDVGSRGIQPSLLPKNILWLHGPPWAELDPVHWPNNTISSPSSIPELKGGVHGQVLWSNSSTPPLIMWMEGISSFTRAVRAFAYILRFKNILKRSTVKQQGHLTLAEIRKATCELIKIIQAQEFFGGRMSVSNADIPKNLISLSPFLDTQGLLLVGGRLRHSNLSWSSKHPIILPSKAHFSKLLIKHYHDILLHPGPTLLLAHLRTKYWVLGARNVVRSIARSCITCKKLDAPVCQPLMADIHYSRFKEGRAFLNVGVDYAGPFLIRDSLRRKSSQSKAYLCLFICLSTRAIHLELVSALSTVAFCAALERFIGRRGLPELIASDNGTNFVGAASELKDLHRWLREDNVKEQLQLYAIQRDIEWKFTPPYGPTFGSSWERGIRSVKFLLRSVYGENLMTFEELATLLIRIEAMLNSRPLCPLSSDTDDLDFLTPGHFLIGSPLLTVPEKSTLHLKENRLTRWQLIQQKAQHFWQRWRLEYITTLQQKGKWRSPDYNIQVGDLVLLVEANVPRLKWPTGRVVEVHKGKDSIVRVVTVRTPFSTFKRPANKVVPLVIDMQDPFVSPSDPGSVPN